MDQRLLEYVIGHTEELVFTFDENGVIDYANQAAQEKLDYENIIGVNVNRVISLIFEESEDKEQTGLITECKFSGETEETVLYRGNLTCFHAEVRLTQLDEKPCRYLCIARDITKEHFYENKAEQVAKEAEDAMKVKSQFVANVTHELRTPVNGILGNTKVLLEEEQDEKRLRILQLIKRGCDDMNNIINNILDFSKLEAGKFTIEEREFDFKNMIEYVKGNHLPKINEKGLQFFVNVSPSVPDRIIGDELRIVQILNNLLSNACKFTANGKITLEVLKTAQVKNRVELFFMVIDTGIGIDKADGEKLFQSFSQVDASISRTYGGTGLGLSICKQLVKLMQGSIGMESEKNVGTNFSFSIWVEVPEEMTEEGGSTVDTFIPGEYTIGSLERDPEQIYGTPQNLEAIENRLEKLILSVEMDNWEKAEQFVEAIRQLTVEAPREVKSAMLKLKMSVQKGDYDKTIEAHKNVEEQLHGEGN